MEFINVHATQQHALVQDIPLGQAPDIYESIDKKYNKLSLASIPSFPLDKPAEYSHWCTLMRGIFQRVMCLDIIIGVSRQPVPPSPVVPQPIPAEEEPIWSTYFWRKRIYELKDSYVFAILTASLGRTQAAINLLEPIPHDHGCALWQAMAAHYGHLLHLENAGQTPKLTSCSI